MNVLWDGPRRLLELAPRWLAGVLGILVLGLGVLLVPRPLTSATALCLWGAFSLALTGVLTLVGSRRGQTSARGRGWITICLSTASILVGGAVVIRLGLAMTVLPLLLAAALLCWGLERAMAALRRACAPTSRVLAASLGASAIALGVVAAWWPDLTVVVSGVAFAIRAVICGVALVMRAAAPRWRPRCPHRVEAIRPALRVVASVLVVALAVISMVVSLKLRSGTPELTVFYQTPSSLPADPGVLVRSQRYTADVPAGVTAWRILYTTTNADGSAAVASGIVAIPGVPGSGPYPVVAIAHGTIGVARNCAISLGDIAVTETAIPAMKKVFANGWAVVATDYTGQGAAGRYPYLVGQSEARSNLDAVRAARQLTSLTRQTVVWGHSQGGHAALWTARIAGSYAPDVPIIATAAFSPASDPYDLARKVLASGSSLSNIVTAYVAASYAQVYPELRLEDYQNPAASVLVRQAAQRCATSPDILVTVLSLLAVSHDRPVFSVDLDHGALADRLRQNLATGPFQGKVFIAQGDDDEVIPISLQRRFVADRCAAGQPIYFREYPGRTHMGILEADSPFPSDLVSWTRQAFAGTAPASNRG